MYGRFLQLFAFQIFIFFKNSDNLLYKSNVSRLTNEVLIRLNARIYPHVSANVPGISAMPKAWKRINRFASNAIPDAIRHPPTREGMTTFRPL